MKLKSESEAAQLCLTLSDPMDCSLPGSSVHRIFQARVLEWGAIALWSGCVQITAKAPHTHRPPAITSVLKVGGNPPPGQVFS